MTPGSAGSTADDTDEVLIIQCLAEALKKRSFRWSPVRRILIPKPGKKDKRPLGLPDFHNKLVQEVIRMILEAIYEPEFEQLNCSSGFRPQKDCNYAIYSIRKNFLGSDWSIEGDIKSAYPSVDHDIFIKILSKRIDDRKFLRLIYDDCRAGILTDLLYSDSFLGIPQGGIASPILFNIYMHEFDKYVLNTLAIELDWSQGGKPSRSTEINSYYFALKSRRYRAASKIRTIYSDSEKAFNLLKMENILKYMLGCHSKDSSFSLLLGNPEFCKAKDNYLSVLAGVTEAEKAAYVKYRSLGVSTKLSDYSEDEQVGIQKFKKSDYYSTKICRILESSLTIGDKVKILDQYSDIKQNELAVTKPVMRQTPFFDQSKKYMSFYYHRYADDWTLWIRGGMREHVKELREKIAKFLLEELKLTLSLEKTKITNIHKDKVKFLGFEIYYQTNSFFKLKITRETQRYHGFHISPDTDRFESRAKLRKYLDNNGRPRELRYLTVLGDHEIIIKYNQFMIGIANYYIREMSFPSQLNRWHYLLYYSCIKTLTT